jgi:hypothetical protein
MPTKIRGNSLNNGGEADMMIEYPGMKRECEGTGTIRMIRRTDGRNDLPHNVPCRSLAETNERGQDLMNMTTVLIPFIEV